LGIARWAKEHGTVTRPNPQEIVAQIGRIHERTHALIEAELKARGMTGIVPAHGAVLAFLFTQTQPVPIKAVVEQVGRVKSTVTVMLNTLERHGYLTRIPCECDNRVTYVALTEKGRSLRPDFKAISERLLTTVYGPMSPHDRQTFLHLLDRIERNLQEAP
jgi:DNA-binding MarR family transcriptional regulator